MDRKVTKAEAVLDDEVNYAALCITHIMRRSLQRGVSLSITVSGILRIVSYLNFKICIMRHTDADK